MIYRRTTLAQPVSFEGNGLHTGVPVRVQIEPCDQGLIFQYGSERVEALAKNVTDTTRCTRLGSISTIEHLMSALAALGITDAHIEVSAPELPALDGSSLEFYQGLAQAGTQSFGPELQFSLFKRVFHQEGDAQVSISSGSGHWRYTFECADRWPFEQTYESASIFSDYDKLIAPARTFAFHTEVPHLLELGLAKGLDLEKALIIGAGQYDNPPKFDDEPARHKMLDLIGDLALSGVPLRALNVTASRSGHRVNVATAAKLAEWATS